MPNIDGFGIIQHLTNVHEHHVGIISITAFYSREYESLFHQSGSDTVLMINILKKPLDNNRLRQEIENAFESVHKNRILTLNKATIDLHKKFSKLENRLSLLPVIDQKINSIKKSDSFFYQLGTNFIAFVILGFAVLVSLYFGLDDFVKSIIYGSK